MLFKEAADPDVENAYLLEQYQANIGAALRPAFGADSLPQVSVLASQESLYSFNNFLKPILPILWYKGFHKTCIKHNKVASEWLCSGVASSINDLQRVYRLMVSALDAIRLPQSKGTGFQ